MPLDFPASPTNGQVYSGFYWDASAGIWRRQLSPVELDDINDVNATAPADNDILVYNTSNSKWESNNVSSATSGQVLRYNGTTWTNARVGLNDITSVSISSAANGDSIYFNGTSWINGVPPLIETAQQTADYTLELSDAGKIVVMNKSTAAILSIPLDSSVAFPIGTVVGVYNVAVNNVTISGVVGVTLRNADVLKQYKEASLRKRAANEWVMVGG